MSGEQLSYVHTPVGYTYNFQTVPERLEHLAKENPDQEVYVFLYPDGKRDSVSVGTLFKQAKALEKSLIHLGLKKGDVVATCLPNDKDALVTTFGVIFAGGIVAHLLLRNENGSDLQHKLTQLSAKALIFHPGYNEEQFVACMSFVDKVETDGRAVSSKVPSLELLISTSLVKRQQLLQLNELLTIPRNTDAKLPRLDPDEVVVLFTTSGSTGDPKFVPHTHHTVMIFGQQAKESIGYDEHDVIYTERRLAWLAGFPVMLLHDCPTVVTLTHPIADFSEHTRFTLNALRTEKCSVACIFPATVIGLQNIMGIDSDGKLLKTIHIAGLTLASNCMKAISVLTEEVTNCYGLSEVGVLTSNHVKEKNTYIDFNTGMPVAGNEVKVVDTDGFVVKRGQSGAICSRSPALANFYYNESEISLSPMLKSGWMDTGDIGYITEDGELIVAGRQSSMSGNLYTGGRYMHGLITYLEALIKEHPSVLDVVAVTAPDDTFVEIVCACVVLLPGKTAKETDIENFCKSKTVPGANNWEDFERIMLFKSFPKLYTGKPDRLAIRKEVISKRANEMKI